MADVTINDLPTAASIDGATDLLAIYTANVTATQSINRNTFLGLASAPVGLTDSQTLTNKTLTSPTLSNPVLSGTVTGTYTLGGTPTFPSSLVTLTGTQTLTNKTLTSPTINSPTITNATFSADTITGYTSTNSGSIYGLTITGSSFNALAASAITTTDFTATGTVTLPDGSVGAAALNPTYVETIGTTDRSFTTSWAATGDSISLTAGTWVVSYKLYYGIVLSNLEQGLISTLSTTTSSTNNIDKFQCASNCMNQDAGAKSFSNTHSVTGVYVASGATTLYLMAKTTNSVTGTIGATTTPILLTAYRIG